MAKKITGKKGVRKKAGVRTPFAQRDAWEDTKNATKWLGKIGWKGIKAGASLTREGASRAYDVGAGLAVEYPKTVSGIATLVAVGAIEFATLGGDRVYDGNFKDFNVVYERDVGAFLFPKRDRVTMKKGDIKYEFISNDPSRKDYSNDRVNRIIVSDGENREIFSETFSYSDEDRRKVNQDYLNSADYWFDAIREEMDEMNVKETKEGYIKRVRKMGEGFLIDSEKEE